MSATPNNQVTDLMAIDEAATIAKCSPRTMRAWIERGLLPYYRLGPRLIRISGGDLQAWLASGRVSAPKAPTNTSQREPSSRETVS
jgi:excisionase family DNA binding protein